MDERTPEQLDGARREILEKFKKVRDRVIELCARKKLDRKPNRWRNFLYNIGCLEREYDWLAIGYGTEEYFYALDFIEDNEQETREEWKCRHTN